jgi:hypothetical protein
LVETNSYASYPPQSARSDFCGEHGWAQRKGQLLCPTCWEELLPEFPPWATKGRLIEAVEEWSDHPAGTRAVVTRASETSAGGKRYRIIGIKPTDPEARWWGNLWLDRGAHFKWTPVKGPSRWDVIGAV